jgi:hypothetical protein
LGYVLAVTDLHPVNREWVLVSYRRPMPTKLIRISFDRPGPVSSTLTEALTRALNFPPLARAKADAAKLKHAVIEDGYWTEQDLILTLEGQRFLHIFVNPLNIEPFVDWAVTSYRPDPGNTPVERIGADPVIFRIAYPRIDKPRLVKVDRSTILSARIGKTVVNLWVAPNEFSVYTPKQRMISISSARNLTTGQHVLYTYEDD